MKRSMTRLNLCILVILVGVGIFWGCGSTQDLVDRTDKSIRTSEPETKVGVIDMLEVLKRTKIGQPAHARWRREVEELTRSLTPWGTYRAFATSVASCEVVWGWERTAICVQPDAEFGIGATKPLTRNWTVTHGSPLWDTRFVFCQRIGPAPP